MRARLQDRSDRVEKFFRGLLGLALVAGVIWALTHVATSGGTLGAPLR